MQNQIIEIDNLIFDYIKEDIDTNDGARIQSSFRAISGATLQIKKGEFVAVIGRNGSGKSTLAKCINGLLIPTEGVVYIKGIDTKDENHIWDVRQTAGMVFQNPDNQLVSAIVEEDVAFGPENIGIESSEIRVRVDEALKAVGMYKYKDRAPHLLSGGQKQRVAIAGAIAMRPEVIIFDEPTAMLDPKGRKEIMEIIKNLNREGITIVIITHFMEEATLADKIYIMDDGHIVLEGAPSEVFEKRDKIRSVNLDVPLAVEIAYHLRKKGIEIPHNVIDEKEMVDYLCQLKQNT